VSRKNTLFNDPIYGFITIESDLILKLINHPYFQRLRRVSQMGLSSLVYPGAHHTRFEHAIGAMHVMQKAIELLIKKGTEISSAESEAMQIAILLHDIGHGPFSHASEKALLQGISHETLSVSVIELLDKEFSGQLGLALQIFKNTFPRQFMNQLVSGQIDVDRLDYLKRDSFYTGVTEGNINTDRIITMMHVEKEQLVFELKGAHSLEKFLLARRLMYWQVYLHKTSLAAELLLVKILERFRELVLLGNEDITFSHILYPLLHYQKGSPLTEELIHHYLTLDDADIYHLIKHWTRHSDLVLRKLSQQLLYRQLPKIRIQETPFTQSQIEAEKLKWQHLSLNAKELDYFVYSGNVSNQTYRSDHTQIWLKNKKSKITPLAETIDYLDFNHFSKPIYRYYLCYPKPPFSL